MTRFPPASALAATGAISHVRPNDITGDEIHLIELDGSSDRSIWSTQRAGVPLVDDVSRLARRTDSGVLAFASRHDEACSFYNSEVYVIRLDGGGYRRVMAAPACTRSRLPTSTV